MGFPKMSIGGPYDTNYSISGCMLGSPCLGEVHTHIHMHMYIYIYIYRYTYVRIGDIFILERPGGV